MFQFAANGLDCSEICRPLFLLCKDSSFIVRYLVVPKAIKGTKSKKRAEHYVFEKEMFPRVASYKIKL